MGHLHGRALHGLEAREHLLIHKRDSHGSRMKMHVPEGFGEKFEEKDSQTAVSVVYVTLPQTFSGQAAYSTLAGNQNVAGAHTELDDLPTPTNAADSDATATSAQAGHNANGQSTSIATVSPQESSRANVMTTFATATASIAGAGLSASNAATAVIGGSPLQATQSPGASDENSGMSGGAKAGLAIGIILAIALVGGLIFFSWRKKQLAHHQEIMDEKHASFADAGARRVEAGGRRDSTMSNMTERVPASVRSVRTASTAPRLSLRPVTQFLPNLGEHRKSSGNALDVAAAGMSEKSASAWERQPSHAPQNPFDDATATTQKQVLANSPPVNPFDEPQNKNSSDVQLSVSADGAIAASAEQSPKSSWEGSQPPTPRSANFGTAAAVPVAAVGSAKDMAAQRGPNNVHRVQLDFKPSMDDELELRSGQLVRMLHEYDDGWALCMRMDRSQQGVTPRTCLSKLPVKPRPQGPPPGSRPVAGQGRRPSNPPMPPPTGTAMLPRPLTPSQSSRSPSPPDMNGEAQAGVPTRKPVPGQAI